MIRTLLGIFFLSIFSVLACNDDLTTEACIVNGDPDCHLAALVVDGGADGTAGNCSADPNLGKVCVTIGGQNGHFQCVGFNLLACISDGAVVDGSTVYRCSTDPLQGTVCKVGPIGSACFNQGTFQCGVDDAVAPKCSVSPKAPNPAEICGNGIDDNCNGNIDESPCTNGAGGVDSGGGTVTGGGATCTTATSITATVLAPSALTSLLKGASAIDTSNPLIKGLVNNDLLALNASGGISVSINTGNVNVFRVNSPGGDPTPLLDDLFCRQLGIIPPTPASCNMGVIGTRSSPAYLSALNADFQCWRSATCVSTIVGFVPGDLFALMKMVQNGDSLSQSPFADSYSGVQHLLVVEEPHLCP
jgi:hypothetical protein